MPATLPRTARRRTRDLISLAALATCVAGPAFAQTALPSGGDEGGAAAATQTRPVVDPSYASVGDIVVTARRRDERAQDVPIALTVINEELLNRTGAYNVAQVTQLAPSVQLLSPNARNTAITIRGLGASYGLANDGLEQGVGIYIDQVYYSRPATATLDFVDIDRIEILRGPQGTLFGKNTTAGALNITTRAPSFTPEAQGELSIGDYNFVQAKATVSGPLIADTLAARLSFVSTRRDGTLDNATVGHAQNAQESISLHGQLLYQPTEKLTVRLYGDYSDQTPDCCTQLYVRVGDTAKPVNLRFAALAAGLGYVPASTNPYDRTADVDGKIQADQIQRGFSAIIDYDFGFATLTSISAWRAWDWRPANDRDYTALDITRQSANPSDQDQWSQELRLSSNGQNRIDWTTGLYAFHQAVETHGITEYGRDASYWLTTVRDLVTNALIPGTNPGLLDGYTVFNNSRIETDSVAVFGQLTWNITDRLHLTPGLRYTHEEKNGVYASTVSGGGPGTAADITRRLGVSRPQAYSAEISDGDLSGQVALSYDVSDNVLAYGSFARGYKSGGINMAGIPNLPDGTPSLTNATVEPEAVTTWELGLKTQLFDKRVTANLAAYRTDVDDYQANVVDTGPGALRGYLANAKKVEIQGIELDAFARPTPWLDAYANLAWTDAKYADFTNGPCPLELIGTTTVACDLSGKDLPGVSPWAASIGGELHSDVNGLGYAGEAYFGADANYRSTYNADASVSKYTEIEGYTVLNLRAGFRADNGWEAFVWVRNALDEDYLQLLTVQAGNSGLVLGTPGDPRTFGLTLRAKY
ncbi:TonB-dependent receptor [Brevundimonas goettingensis]|uniref:TonB-dependent receptor n=1 Tax=Brevundimonas goettingensis TaxID=2774190 RepID=A0A975C4W2_9CAUL|nr:TonB-dependent receptor [Brevundimonas goettingensis]QTC91965.1 TonB-dependent receptor [Brevundimonas goettingensis]